MEKIDFDQLCKNAYHSDAGLKDKDALWLEVFKLNYWYAIAVRSDEQVSPYIADAPKIEKEGQWLYLFTHANRATFFAKRNDLYEDELTNPIIEIDTSQLSQFVESLKTEGLKGVFFNAEGHGFFTVVEQLLPIAQHLKDSYPDQF